MPTTPAGAPLPPFNSPEDTLRTLRDCANWWRAHHTTLTAVAQWWQAQPETLPALITWWQQRQDARQGLETDGQTRRVTFHIQQQWVDAITQQAEHAGLSRSQVLNQALRTYFNSKGSV